MSEILPGWKTTDIDGHAVDVYVPERPHEHKHVIVYLHGVHLRRLTANANVTNLLHRHGLTCVAPMTGSCWWLNRICPDFDAGRTPEQHLRNHVLPWIAATFGKQGGGIALIGTSMGGQGAVRLALQYPNEFPVAAAIAPAVDFHTWLRDGDEVLAAMFDSVEAARQETALLLVDPLRWPRHLWFCCDPQDDRWWESADKLEMKLRSMGVPHTADLETSGGGHGWEYYDRMFTPALEFVLRGLEQERLRIA